MKVLQINSVCGIGSTGRIVTDIHNMLLEQGHESYVAYGRDLPKNCNNSIRIGSKIDNYTHAAITRVFDKHGFGSKRSTIEFIDKVERINPDIIHLHNIHGYYINIEILFKYLKESRKQVVWTLHDCWSFTGHCSHFDYVGCKKWEKECYDCPQKKRYPTSFCFDNSRKNYNIKKLLFTGIENMTIVTPSKWLYKTAKKSFLKEYPVKVINNGIDLDIFKPTDNNFREIKGIDDKFIILGVANVWNDRKGFQCFIELSSMLADDEIIVLVGLTEKQKRHIPDNIIGITRTNDTKELVEIYTASNVFVNPTLEEVLGMTNIEALACGTPVITYNTGGSVESIGEKCGYVTKNKDSKNIYNEIKILRKVTPEARDCIEKSKEFSKYKKLSMYIDLYKTLETMSK